MDFLVVISGAILLISVSKIRKFLKKHDESINTRNMGLHLTIFGLFTFSLLIEGLSSIGR